MLGDVVPLFLCRSCKGLFILESQVEKHAVDCNGEAVKSPANLFACERDHYLEFIAPSIVGTKTNKISLASERKRRKTSPIISNKSNTVNTRRSFLSKDDLSTLTSGKYYGMVTPQIWNACSPSDRLGLIPHSHSLDKPEQNRLVYNEKGTKMGQCTLQQNLINTVASLSGPVSQQFILPLTDESSTFQSCFSQKTNELTFPTKQTRTGVEENVTSAESDSDVIQRNNTPATNLLAYLSQLQQGDGSTTEPKKLIAQEQLASLTLTKLSNSAEDSTPFYGSVLDSQVSETLNGPCTVTESSMVQSSQSNPTEANHHVKIVADVLTLDAFHLKPSATITSVDGFNAGSDNHGDGGGTIHEFLPVMSDDSNKGPEETIRRNDGEELQDTGTHNVFTDSLQNNDKNVQLQGDRNHVIGFGNPEILGKQSLKQDSNLQQPVMYILKPDGCILPVAVENVLAESSEVNGSLTVSVGMDAVDTNTEHGASQATQISETGLASVCDKSALDQAPLSVSSVETVDNEITATSGGDTYMRSVKIMQKTKSKNQLRLEELSALREEVLLQATEIPPDSESKKTRYRCKVCGHLAKSVKFMHNHLQMHADGKVFYECDQCDFKNRLRSKLVEHQQRHSRSKFLCHSCPATFMDLASLNRHVSAKHSENEDLKCDQCSFTASYPNLMKEHMLKHSGELYSCSEEGCQYKTPYLRALRVHQKRHTCEKNYRCTLCSYEAVEKSTLDRHMKSHTQERPYQCSSCSFRANTRHAVVLHMQHKHEEQKSFYVCDKCPFRTAYASSIAKHLKTHTGTFTCPLCKHSSRTLTSIKKHLQQVHQLENIEVVDNPTKINTKDYLQTETEKPLMESDKPLIDSLMMDTMNVDSQDLPPLPMADMERSHIDPMKLSFHFQDLVPGPFMPSGSGTNLTRSSSIPDLFTFSQMNRTNSQSDLLNCPGISTMTRSNSMSDLITFASNMCTDSGEHVNMDVSLSDASAPPMDVGGLSLGDGPEVSLTDVGRPGSPLSALFVLQCSKCLALMMNEEDVDSHKKICTGTILMV